MEMVPLIHLNAAFICSKDLSVQVDTNNFANFGPRMRFDWGDKVKSKKFIRYYLYFSAN